MKATRTMTITLTKEQAAEILVAYFGQPKATVDFSIGEVDGDPLDRYPGRKDVVAVKVTYEEDPTVRLGSPVSSK